MKRIFSLLVSLATLGLVTSVVQAQADLLDGLGDWRGTGTAFSPDGRSLSDFRVELTRAAAGPESVETRGRVTLTDGHVFPISRRITRTPDGFTSESSGGKGHGHCPSPNVCYFHEADGAGNSSLTTVLVDAPGHLRVLVTELEAGQPVRVIWQTLSKQ
jgi:hypothetical protein